MKGRAGIAISSVASLGLLGALASAYVAQSTRNVTVYYGSGLLNPLLAGLLALGVLVAVVAVNANYVSAEFGAGIVFGFSLFILLIVSVWVLTGRVDLFRAPGWGFPVHRWALVGIAALILVGAILYTVSLDRVSPEP